MPQERFEISVADSAASLLKNLRLRSGKTQREIADIAGVGSSFISNVEKGTRSIDPTAAYQVSKELGERGSKRIEAVFSAAGIAAEETAQTIYDTAVEVVTSVAPTDNADALLQNIAFSPPPSEYTQLSLHLPEPKASDTLIQSPTHPRLSKVERIAAEIERRIASGKYQDQGGKIPTRDQVAHDFSVSLPTASKAFRMMRHAGRIEQRGTRGHFITGSIEEKPPEKASRIPKKVFITNTLRQRILNGDEGYTERIPFVHNLALEFGCTSKTVSTALRALNKEGLVFSLGSSGVHVNKPRVEEIRRSAEESQ